MGAAHAQGVEFIADGADWIWDRAESLRQQAQIPADIWVEVVDFYHASQHLHAAVELCRSLSGKKRDRLFRHLRHLFRTDPRGVALVIERLKQEAKTRPACATADRRGKKMHKAIAYFEKHAHRMRYAYLDESKLPVGSGQVESAVPVCRSTGRRRVVNLRFKAPGTFWNEVQVGGLMHLRACFKAGRWEEMMQRVLTRTFQVPSFEPLTPQQQAALFLESLDLASPSHEIHEAA